MSNPERMTAAEYQYELAHGKLQAAIGRRLGKKKHKFGAIAVKVDGHHFPSKLEARRYGQLKQLLRAGEIEDLKLQPRFPLEVDGVVLGTYVADFSYRQFVPLTRGSVSRIKVRIIEDAKGVETQVYKLKRDLFLQLYPSLEFREIKKCR